MNIDNSVLSNEEKIYFRLRSIYSNYGYSYFKMSKFEEYDLYVQNKDFLISDSVMAFTDTNGKLMALKPDVTLSIVKNSEANPTGVQKLYYNENVYRISDSTHRYKEIMQTGLECIGNLDEYNLLEVVWLAAESLKVISADSVLVLSDLGVISAILSKISCDNKLLLQKISEKNLHGVEQICLDYGISGEYAEILKLITCLNGAPKDVIGKLRNETGDNAIISALGELERVAEFLEKSGITVRVDFSLIGDMNYYDGLIFRGFVKEIPTRVLSGGQYNKLMSKMGKRSKAVGFAVYLDLTERIEEKESYDADVLYLYDKGDNPVDVLKEVGKYAGKGMKVVAFSSVPEKLTFKRKVKFGEEVKKGK